MSRLTDRNIEKLLRQNRSPEPPPELLERLEQDLTELAGSPTLSPTQSNRPGRARWAWAASFLVAIGGAFLGHRVLQEPPANPAPLEVAVPNAALDSETALSQPKRRPTELEKTEHLQEEVLTDRLEEATIIRIEQEESSPKSSAPESPEFSRLQKEMTSGESLRQSSSGKAPPQPAAWKTSPPKENVTYQGASPRVEPEVVEGWSELRSEDKESITTKSHLDESKRRDRAIGEEEIDASGPRDIPEEIAVVKAESPPQLTPARASTVFQSTATEGSRGRSTISSESRDISRDTRIDPATAQRYDRRHDRLDGAQSMVDTTDEALSTFALDVDTASYTVIRRYLDDGHLPPPAAVRVEEMINFFDYGDPLPEVSDFALNAEGAPSPIANSEGSWLLRLHVQGREVQAADRVFVENLTGALFTIASDARIQVQFDEGSVRRYRLIGYENRDMADREFRNDAADAGEIGAGHGVTAVYELDLHRPPARGDRLAILNLRYRSTTSGEFEEDRLEVLGKAFSKKWKKATPSFRLTSIVTEFGELLREGRRNREKDLEDLFIRAQMLSAEFSGDHKVAELVSLIGRAARLEAREVD